jgi:hypothetical protein
LIHLGRLWKIAIAATLLTEWLPPATLLPE